MTAPLRKPSPVVSTPDFEAVLQALPQPVVLLDAEQQVSWCNRAAEVAFGAEGSRAAVETLLVQSADPASAANTPLVWGDYAASLRQLPSGHSFLVLQQSTATASPAVAPADVDELTGVAKRNALLNALDRALARARESGSKFAVHYLDLDRFKVVNDTLGHGVGDLLLKKVTDRLRSACRESDVIARIGGDEFAILQQDVNEPGQAERLAARIVDLIGRTYVLEGHTINIGVSVGVALPGDRTQARDILRDADLALYEAKRAGRARFRVFEPDMNISLRERRELEIDLRRALALRQFELYYQPFVDLESKKTGGFEALLRWNHPVRGIVPPLSFIPMAEETGLIVKLGEWVLRTACETAATWPEHLTVAVNVSPLQFKADNLLDTVRGALARSGLSSHRLELEITESALLDDTSNVLTTLHSLRELGIKISMDDFGTGYSSLSYLQKFPFDKIKIDRSFVAEDTSDSRAILKAVASLGKSLGMAITAEGVETVEQLESVRNERCTHVQGYFTGKPMRTELIDGFLKTFEGR